MARLDVSAIEAELLEFMNDDLLNRSSPSAEKRFKEICQGKSWETERDTVIFSQHGGLTKDDYMIIEISKEQGYILLQSAKDPAIEHLKHEKMGDKDIVKSIKGKIIFVWPQ